MRSLPFLASLALFLTILAPRASAEDEIDPGKALLEKLTELRKAEEVDGLAKAVAEVPEVYKASEDKSLKGKLRDELGKVLKDDDLGAARRAALGALLALEAPKDAWKEIKRVMPDRKLEEATELDVAIVRAAGTLAQSRAVKPLLELAFKAKDASIAAAACEALGCYKEDTRGRVKILEELISCGVRTRPGQTTEVAASEESRKRWATVAPGIIKGLNDLTGRSISSFEDWEVLYKEHKKRPKELFVD